jgi:hypothetical protein
MGHIARNFPQAKCQDKNTKFKRNHAHFVGEAEPDRKKKKKMIQMNYIFCDIGLSTSKALDSYQVILIAVSHFFPH